jgi:hypothetical protein
MKTLFLAAGLLVSGCMPYTYDAAQFRQIARAKMIEAEVGHIGYEQWWREYRQQHGMHIRRYSRP